MRAELRLLVLTYSSTIVLLQDGSAIGMLIDAMDSNSQLGGVCGEICVDRPFASVQRVAVAAQHFEYKSSHVMDKAMESLFGFISVLPGAFSAYRLEAIEGGPLDTYLLSPQEMGRFDAFKGNMYLAEDRILCFELLVKKGCNYTMKYVK